MAVQTDVAGETSVQELISRARQRFGEIDLFVSNAGLTVTGGFEVPDADWRCASDVNLMAHVYAARAVLPAMLERGRGHLLQAIAAGGSSPRSARSLIPLPSTGASCPPGTSRSATETRASASHA